MSNIKTDYNFARAKAYSNRQKFLILHYTVADFRSSLEILTNRLSVHYLVALNKEDDPSYSLAKAKVFNLIAEDKKALHAGVSAFGGCVNLNDTSIGVEIVNLTEESTGNFRPFPGYQIEMVIDLCKSIINRYSSTIKPTNVLGHADIAFNRKSDPGPLFPWRSLYDAGIGAWYDQEDVVIYRGLIEQSKITKASALDKIQEYGYCFGYQQNRRSDRDFKNLTRAFQMHFRPAKYDGVLDVETAAIMFALWKKYKAKADDPLVAILEYT